jgi:hypothetical protein
MQQRMAELRRLLPELRFARVVQPPLALVGDSMGGHRAGSADLAAKVSVKKLI